MWDTDSLDLDEDQGHAKDCLALQLGVSRLRHRLSVEDGSEIQDESLEIAESQSPARSSLVWRHELWLESRDGHLERACEVSILLKVAPRRITAATGQTPTFEAAQQGHHDINGFLSR